MSQKEKEIKRLADEYSYALLLAKGGDDSPPYLIDEWQSLCNLPIDSNHRSAYNLRWDINNINMAMNKCEGRGE